MNDAPYTGNLNVMSPNCGNLLRVSSSAQRDDETIELQIKCNRDAIEALNGVEVEEFRDEAMSAYSRAARQRPGVVKLIEAVQEGQIDTIVFFDESRLTRQILDFYQDVYAPIMRVNPDIKFYRSIDGVYWDPNSKEAKHNLILAYQESHKKSRLAKQSQQHQVNNNQRPGARLPFGIQQINGDVLVPDEKFPIVLFVFELAARGYSERHIAKVLNDMKVVNDHTWGHTSIHHILRNPLYIGHLAVGRRRDKNNGSLKPLEELTELQIKINRYRPLVPIDLWDLAQIQLKNKSNDKSIRMQSSFLLTGILKCSSCNEMMKARNSIKQAKDGSLRKRTKKGGLLKYYFCPKCERRVDPDEIDSEIIHRISMEMAQNITAKSIYKTADKFDKRLKKRIADFDAEIQERRLQLNHLENGFYDKQWDRETVRHLMSVAAERLRELEDMKQSAAKLRETIHCLCSNNDSVERLVRNARAINTILPAHELRVLVMQMIESIEVQIGRSGNVTIELIVYRMLPVPYIYNEVGSI